MSEHLIVNLKSSGVDSVSCSVIVADGVNIFNHFDLLSDAMEVEDDSGIVGDDSSLPATKIESHQPISNDVPAFDHSASDTCLEVANVYVCDDVLAIDIEVNAEMGAAFDLVRGFDSDSDSFDAAMESYTSLSDLSLFKEMSVFNNILFFTEAFQFWVDWISGSLMLCTFGIVVYNGERVFFNYDSVVFPIIIFKDGLIGEIQDPVFQEGDSS